MIFRIPVWFFLSITVALLAKQYALALSGSSMNMNPLSADKSYNQSSHSAVPGPHVVTLSAHTHFSQAYICAIRAYIDSTKSDLCHKGIYRQHSI